jgi:hypothetical protein
LWGDSTSESDPSITANDFQGPSTISAFAFRQNAGEGALTADDLIVGTTFANVLGGVSRPSLRIDRVAPGQVRLAWPAFASGFTVQTIGDVASSNWQDVATSPAVTGGENVVTNSPATNPAFYRLKK